MGEKGSAAVTSGGDAGRETRHALIVGAGVGGLCAAIALQRAGLRVTVLEQAEEMREEGAGLSLWPNAIKALEALGLGGFVDSDKHPPFGGTILRSDGTRLSRVSAAAMQRRFGRSPIVVHRTDLQEALLNAVGEGVVRVGARVTGYEQDADGVSAALADGTSLQGDLLVGADGVHSAVREQMLGPAPLRYAGYTAWRAVVTLEEDLWRSLSGQEVWGRGARFGLAPMSGRRVYWFAAANAPQGAGDPPEGRKRDVLDRFGGWQGPARQIIEATPEEAILRHDVYDRDPLRRWGQGRVTLLGDAAHAVTPNLGQGACQAIEDAVTLRRCLADTGFEDTVGALREYERRRMGRTARIVRLSRLVGRMGQWENPLLCRARDAAARLTPEWAIMRQLAPVIGYEA